MEKQLKLCIKEGEQLSQLLREHKLAPALNVAERLVGRLQSIGRYDLAETAQDMIDELEAKGHTVLAMYAREANDGR